MPAADTGLLEIGGRGVDGNGGVSQIVVGGVDRDLQGPEVVLRGPGSEPYFIAKGVHDSATGVLDVAALMHQVVERLSVSGRVVLRGELSEECIRRGLESGELRYFTQRELLNLVDRSKSGVGITGGGDSAGIADCLAEFAANLDPSLLMIGVKSAGKGLIVDPSDFSKYQILVDNLLVDDMAGHASTPFGSSRVDKVNGEMSNVDANLAGRKFFYGTGGGGNMTLLELIASRHPEMTVVGTFKSIDGDGAIGGRPVQMLGFDSAARHYREAIWAIATSAAAHEETTVVETFGRNSGLLPFAAASRNPQGLQAFPRELGRQIQEFGGNMTILVPEKPTSLRSVAEESMMVKGISGSSIVVVSEGFMPPELQAGIDYFGPMKDLRQRWSEGQLTLGMIKHLVVMSDCPNAMELAEVLADKELALLFAKAAWESKKDAFGNGVEPLGIRKFVMSAIRRFGGLAKVNEALLNRSARGIAPSEYDSVMGRRVGGVMAQVVNSGIKGGKAVVYFEGMDPYRDDPEVVDLVGVSGSNNLNTSPAYSDRILREGGVFWKQ